MHEWPKSVRQIIGAREVQGSECGKHDLTAVCRCLHHAPESAWGVFVNGHEFGERPPAHRAWNEHRPAGGSLGHRLSLDISERSVSRTLRSSTNSRTPSPLPTGDTANRDETWLRDRLFEHPE